MHQLPAISRACGYRLIEIRTFWFGLFCFGKCDTPLARSHKSSLGSWSVNTTQTLKWSIHTALVEHDCLFLLFIAIFLFVLRTCPFLDEKVKNPGCTVPDFPNSVGSRCAIHDCHSTLGLNFWINQRILVHLTCRFYHCRRSSAHRCFRSLPKCPDSVADKPTAILFCGDECLHFAWLLAKREQHYHDFDCHSDLHWKCNHGTRSKKFVKCHDHLHQYQFLRTVFWDFLSQFGLRFFHESDTRRISSQYLQGRGV